ncbi:sigma-54-dependent transcriptional regulator [Filimonas effusa]|uniref:Sigma-54-dependent Fis family transcriptional regulator n=1 Tax=Filimonas effusa TaxID=2508721 RepID=A0A4V1M9V0_9BACT|nr:sigma-54 dependent transcriptional regulator [Filimonas effusa]RXK82944.1 sigma-54-dependent Fis family transcriptional regulator [Filimonas effusa]
MKNVLIIDDEEKLRNLLSRILRSEGFEVQEAGDGKSALKKVAQSHFDAILCDVKLPDTSGVALVQQLKQASPVTEIILLTAYGNIADGVQAIKNGAFDYITKGDDNEKILPLLHRAIEKSQLQKRVQELEKRVGNKFSFDAVIGKSKAIKEAIALAEKVTPLDTAVLLTGETGTGKEVFAQAIHQASPRSGKSFVALNCSTFSKEILESELFGHKQGAFTGALKDQKGLIEEASGGTLFLDEIGEMPLELQAKLLRVLENNEFIRLGDTKPTKANFRLIAATNRDLKKESEAQRFRPDLYFRLNIFEIHLPPLRERVKDIPALATFFADLFAGKTNKKTFQLTGEFLEKLQAYPWPGNIRELKNSIERAVILASGTELTGELLPADMQTPVLHTNGLSAFNLASIEKLHIQRVLNHTRNNKAEAARLLNIGLATLYRKIEEYGISQ